MPKPRGTSRRQAIAGLTWSAGQLVREARDVRAVLAAAPPGKLPTELVAVFRRRRDWCEQIMRVARAMPAPSGVKVQHEATKTVAALDAFLAERAPRPK